MLTESEKETLLKLARATLEEEDFKPSLTPALEEKRGAFVTLTKKGKLRGCIGYVQGIKPLFETVKENTLNAAFSDTRFLPVTKDEIKDIKIEISAMTPLKKIDDLEMIKVGEHGLYLKRGFSSGLLLPQVAVEYGWDRDEFLSQTCYKAGLAPDAYQDQATEVYIFSAEVFIEA